MLKIKDMPKIECPFIRKETKNGYIVTSEINKGYEWVFEDDKVMAIEKLHGTNVSIAIKDGVIVGCWNRTTRVPFFNRGKEYIIIGLLTSYAKGYMEFLPDGQHFGELIGERVNGNPYKIKGNLWIPFSTYGQKHLRYKSWGKYPKDFDTISKWFKDDLIPLYASRRGDRNGFVEGVVFTLATPNGYKYAKLRKDMFPWFKGKRHGGMTI